MGNKIDKVKLGIAGGLLWGIALMLVSLASINTGYGDAFLEVIMSIYPGVSASLIGSIIALAYGFVDAFLGFFILVWLYEKLS